MALRRIQPCSVLRSFFYILFIKHKNSVFTSTLLGCTTGRVCSHSHIFRKSDGTLWATESQAQRLQIQCFVYTLLVLGLLQGSLEDTRDFPTRAK